jgi:CheY-like chemotaxis protein
MPHGGKLFIRLEKSQLTQEMQKGHLGSKPGRLGTGVMIDVRDTGTGMDTKTQARVFEPFYTTKEVGKGTGLGLSTVLGIVEQSSGNISLTSELGKGTTFHVFLPSTIQEDTAKHDTEAIEPNVGSHGTILLVEDEDQLRGLIGSILKNNGYTVLDAATPSEALALLKAHNRPIDLLLTDVVMPGMSGGMMAKEMRGIQPSLRVLFMSGYTNDVVVKQGVESSEVSFIQKPFAPNELLRQIKKILD